MLVADRITWIDSAKGIGIILVVLGHICLVKEEYNYINSFHVPLFFFLSGYLVRFEKYDSVRLFITEKFNSIIVPYFYFSLLSYFYWIVIERRFSGNVVSPLAAFVNIFIAPGGDQYLPHNPALWFLPCLFMVAVVFYTLARKQRIVNILLLLLVSLVIGYGTTLYLPASLPWSLGVVPTAIVFYGVGFIMKKIPKVCIVSNYIRLVIVCCCMPIGIKISQINECVLVADNFYGSYYRFYLAAFMGITSAVMIAKMFQSNWLLGYLGRNSMIIFALHFPVKRLVTGLTCKTLSISLAQVKSSFFLSSIDTILTISILLPIIYLIQKHFCFILGRKYGNNRVIETIIRPTNRVTDC